MTPEPAATAPGTAAGVTVGGGGSTSGPGSSGAATDDGGPSPWLLGPLVAMGGILLVVGRRRRSRPDTTALGAAAAGPDDDTGPLITDEGIPVDEEMAPVDDDAPLRQARRSMRTAQPVLAGAAVATARTFDRPPTNGAERAKVGYRRVRISSEPDAIGSAELGRLERGDEVEIMESHEGFLQIRTPDNVTGWILRHTIVGAPTG